MDQNLFFKPLPAISTRGLNNNGAVLYDADRGIEKAINTTGFLVWQRLNGSRSAACIADDIKQYFKSALPDTINSDIHEFLCELESENFAAASNHPHDLSEHGKDLQFPNYNDAPKSLDLSLTGKCNLNCAYCFYNDEMALRPDLKKEAWFKFFNELGRLAVRDVTLSGGEIFVRPDIWELIDSLTANRMRYSINTNGTLITQKTINAFEQGRRKIRLNSIQVSIDGSCAAIHDKSRGKGSFEKAVHGLRLLKEAQLPVTVRVTINRYNVDSLGDTAKLLLGDIGINSFGTNDAMPMGSGSDNQPDIAITPEQQIRAMEILSGLKKKYKDRITAMAGPLAKIQSFKEMEHARKTGEKTTRWHMGYLTACGCMYNKLSIHHDGIITPCNMLGKLEMGRINIDSLSEIWKHHPVLDALKNRRKIPMNQVPGCEHCEWNEFCNGSCPGLAFEMTGNFNLANPHDCYRKFLKDTRGI